MTDHTAEIAAIRADIVELYAADLAHESLLFSLLVGLDASGEVPKHVLNNVFEVASQRLQTVAMRVENKDQKTPSGQPHTLRALAIVEELRSAFEAP